MTFYSAAAATASVTYCMHGSPAHPRTFVETAWLNFVHLSGNERTIIFQFGVTYFEMDLWRNGLR